ncbi:MAG: PqqD family protein [Candidatus Omnitrophica bacterium]|nr:PqqD family protein [Candidatus Omnitrophota bacterium]
MKRQKELNMEAKVSINTAYAPSEDVVARSIHGELIIIPITSGIGDAEGEIFTLNETGQAVWNKLDGKRSLKDLAKELASEFEGSAKEIEKDVLGIVNELVKRRMIVKSSRN